MKTAASLVGLVLLLFGGGTTILSGFTLLSTAGACVLGNCLERAEHRHFAMMAVTPGFVAFVIGVALLFWSLWNISDEDLENQ